MNILEILLAVFGLLVSPISGVYFFMLRLKTKLKSAKVFWGYLLFGFINVGITFITVIILPEGSWLIYWGYLIIFLYIVVYGQSPYTRHI